MANPVLPISLLSSFVFNRYGKGWRRTYAHQRGLLGRLRLLAVLSVVYLSLWGSWFYFNCETTKDYEPVKCYDYMVDFFQSPSWQQFLRSLDDLKLYIKIHGLSGLYRDLKEMFGGDSEQDAFAVLDLPGNATKEEITHRYRQLSRQWHPDKQQTELGREQAQAKFIQIQEAYQVLTKKGRTSRA